EELFEITEDIGSISAQQRTEDAIAQINTFAQNEALNPEDLQVGDQDGILVVFYNNTVVFRITEADAAAVDSAPRELVYSRLEQLQQAIATYRQNQSLSADIAPNAQVGWFHGVWRSLSSLTGPDDAVSYGRAILYSAIATGILLLLLTALRFIFPQIYVRLDPRRNTWIPNFEIGNVELVSQERMAKVMLKIARKIRVLITFGIFVVYILFILSFFPWTRRIVRNFFRYLVENLVTAQSAFLDYLPNLITIALIATLVYYCLRFIKPIFSELSRETINFPGFYPEWAEPTYRLLELAVLALAAVMIVPYLPGFGSPAFQGISLFVGLLLSLGSTTAVSNAVAGIILIYTRAFQVGDRVRIGDILGDVEEKSLLVTRIRTFENTIVTLPNGELLSSDIKNYSASVRDSKVPIILSTTVTLGYDVPWPEVYRTLVVAGLNTDDVLADPQPFVLQTSLGDFSVAYELKVYTNEPRHMELIFSQLHQNIQDQCNTAGIEILSPQYSAVRDGNTSTIPESYLPENYKSPGFQVNPIGNLLQVDLNWGTASKNGKKRSSPPKS
ncbi:MAG: mechanosensitive ion channel family protein, partial [Jaaginema sp. PMC 1079.18]|nr:mechanosensitive ion channel family protein [Jaaginema sp. PMC 1079.18]